MYARVTFGQTPPEKLDELSQIVHNSILPVMQQQPGFKGFLALTDAGTGKGITISIWETEANVQESEGGYYREGLAKAAQFFTAPPTREVYEVREQV
ncbi:MAG: hypothetical protein NVSMB38_45560 [Ktedonobacteraceae bacterium]